MTSARRLAVGMVLALLPPSASLVEAQVPHHVRRAATPAEVVLGNILIGGATAATRAALGRKNIWKAFGLGSIGGAVHVVGKSLAVEPGAGKGWAGLALASTGTSVVANAGRGVAPVHEFSIPVASLRVRVTPREARRVRFVVNGYESILIVSALFTDNLVLDKTRSLSSGAMVFETRGVRIVSRRTEVGGLASGPVVLIDPLGRDPERTTRHELIHVHQHWFVADAWSRPVEEFVRAKVPGGRRIPVWLELGFQSSFWYMDHRMFGDRGLYAMMQAEAERLEKR